VILSLSELCRISGQGKDNAETVMAGFFKICYRSCCKYGTTGHPLQSLADAITMEEFKTDHRPKVVFILHHTQKFASGCRQFFCGNDALQDADFVITHPEGYELNLKLLKTPRLSTIRIKHLKMLILSTPKNWSSYKDYGKITNNDPNWTVTADKMKLTMPSSCTVCPLDVT
jgi:N-succinyl-L-ornithine transcarbamylase